MPASAPHAEGLSYDGRDLREGDANASAAQLMEPGPSTTRPTDPGELVAQLRHTGASIAILTMPEGELLGVVRAIDLPGEA
jgi:hypothetical protein